MKIQSKAIIRRQIGNIEADIKACRNSGNTLRMRILYSQLVRLQVRLVNMKN